MVKKSLLQDVINHKISFSLQSKILSNCIENNLKLHDELERLGYSYDNLRYRHAANIITSNSIYKQVSEVSCKHHGTPHVSFFSGCGGLDLGFESAGFKHLASFELNQLYASTIKLNRPNWKVFSPPEFSGDLRNRDEIVDILKNKVGVSENFDGVFHGGPPCQPFSIAANQRFAKKGSNFKRIGFSHKEYGNLLFDFIYYVDRFHPRVFLLENVTGLGTIDEGLQIKKAMDILSKSGYEFLGPSILNAVNFGVPQYRKRLILIGWRSNASLLFPQEESYIVPVYKIFEKTFNGIKNHETRKHEALSVNRYMELEVGKREKLGRVDRLDPNIPSKTVIAGGSGGGGRSHLHPFVPRTLSVRESARLQTFPDDYIFVGPSARQFTQIGNAVPPLFSFVLAKKIYNSIFS